MGLFQSIDPDLGMHITDCWSNEGFFPRLSELFWCYAAWIFWRDEKHGNIFNKNIWRVFLSKMKKESKSIYWLGLGRQIVLTVCWPSTVLASETSLCHKQWSVDWGTVVSRQFTTEKIHRIIHRFSFWSFVWLISSSGDCRKHWLCIISLSL